MTTPQTQTQRINDARKLVGDALLTVGDFYRHGCAPNNFAVAETLSALRQAHATLTALYGDGLEGGLTIRRRGDDVKTITYKLQQEYEHPGQWLHAYFYGEDRDGAVWADEDMPKDARPLAVLFMAAPRLLAAAKDALALMIEELEDNAESEADWWAQTHALRDAIREAEDTLSSAEGK